MATRPTSLELFAATTLSTVVPWQHASRMMTKAPGRYNTSLGRGSRDAQVNVDWLGSSWLSGVIGDPKNASVEVPRYGDLPLFDTRIEARQIVREGNALDFHAPNRTTISDFPLYASILPSDGGKTGTFFDDFVSEINYVAHRWNSDHHQKIHRTYAAELSLGHYPSVKVSVLLKQDEQDSSTQWWIQRSYARPHNEESEVLLYDTLAPIQRSVAIVGKHITMLAMLWADTLKRLDVLDPNSELPPVDGGQSQTTQSTSPQKTKASGGKKTKAVRAPPPTAFDNLGPPASPRASQQLYRPDYTLSLSPRARAGMLDAIESLQEGHSPTATPEHPQYAERIAC